MEGLVLELELHALGAIGERVEGGRWDLGGEGGGKIEVALEAVDCEELELMVELIVEVAGFEDEFLIKDVLVDADVVGAGALGGDGVDVVGVNG